MNARNNSIPDRSPLRKKLSFWIGTSVALAITLGSPSSLHAQGTVITKLTSWAKSHGKPPTTAEDKSLEQLAANVDWLEHHINQWGSVSSKAPDVWGEEVALNKFPTRRFLLSPSHCKRKMPELLLQTSRSIPLRLVRLQVLRHLGLT
ncbi:MAG: hypothetical protein MUC43_20550 [Pirellula sp.]|nr:hypothetical protein [Pirellula sp.]